jgi:hypothetical protein
VLAVGEYKAKIMKNRLQWTALSIFVCGLFFGCVSSQPVYRSEVSVIKRPQSASNKNEYFVEIRVFKTDKSKKQRLIAAPHLMLVKNKPAKSTVASGDYITTTSALMKTGKNGNYELLTAVTKMKGSDVIWSVSGKTEL